jgi:hypothetical protein
LKLNVVESYGRGKHTADILNVLCRTSWLAIRDSTERIEHAIQRSLEKFKEKRSGSLPLLVIHSLHINNP